MRKTMSHAALILLAAVSSIQCGGAGAGHRAGHAMDPAGHAMEPAGHAMDPAGHAGHAHEQAHGRPAAGAPDEELRAVAAIHGGAGPWAVAGYRMGRYALAKLGLPARSFDLEVIHHSPRNVQFSCIADGAAAATGASLGKLNLSLVEATEAAVETTYRRRSTGQTVTLRPSAAFRARFRDVPRDGLEAAGREVLSLPDAEVFEEVPPPPAGASR
ncbi:FmdE family protein [Sorangium cellulosum]|uniref:FmdE family protein n=1 Tax=Sorangium cellulosum TaxID=56 RepID=UPI000A6196EE|nr:FmdE family protein [Sorangium cellulosum]